MHRSMWSWMPSKVTPFAIRTARQIQISFAMNESHGIHPFCLNRIDERDKVARLKTVK